MDEYFSLITSNNETINCKLASSFEFEGQKYALIINLDNKESDDKVIMRIITKLEPLSEQEFNNVVGFLESEIKEVASIPSSIHPKSKHSGKRYKKKI